jgi:alpha-L-arabinofuranosidase
MSAVSDMVNGWSGGIIQASRHAVFVTPTYLVNLLYASHLGRERLASTLRGPTFASTFEGTNVPALDAVVSRSANGQQIFIKVVNTDPTQAIPMQILLTGVRVAKKARMEMVNGNEPTASNDFSSPDAVHIKTNAISTGPSFIVTLPEHSVSVITLAVER